MRNGVRISVRALAAILGLVQLGLGLAFWAGSAYSLVPVHILIGFALTILLFVAAWVGARSGRPRGLVWLAVGWAIMLPVFGITHAAILPGPLHWIIRVLHLAVGIAALAQIGALTQAPTTSTAAVARAART